MKTKILLLLAGMVSANAQSAEQIEIVNSQGITLKAHLYQPAVESTDGEYPGVVMMHGCKGAYSWGKPNASYTNVQSLFRQWGERLAQAGYKAILVDSFTNRGEQNQCSNGADGVSEVYARPLDAIAAYDYLIDNEQVAQDKVGLLGWSHGGSSVFAALSDTQERQPFASGVSFYPGCGLWNAFGGITNSYYKPYAPMQILHGQKDSLYYTGKCDKRRNNAVSAGSEHFLPIIVYKGAKHSFDYVSSSKSADDVRARVNADGETLSFFYKTLQ